MVFEKSLDKNEEINGLFETQNSLDQKIKGLEKDIEALKNEVWGTNVDFWLRETSAEPVFVEALWRLCGAPSRKPIL